jgi:hypothetical protein
MWHVELNVMFLFKFIFLYFFFALYFSWDLISFSIIWLTGMFLIFFIILQDNICKRLTKRGVSQIIKKIIQQINQ